MLAASSLHDLVDWITHMNWVDFVFLVVIVYSVVTGAWIGFMAECVSLAGVALGVLVAGITYNGAGTLLGHLGIAKEARDWVGFAAVFVLISLAFRLGAIFARKISQVMIRGWSNKVAGGLMGLLVGSVLCLTALVTVAYFGVGSPVNAAGHLTKVGGPLVDPVDHSKIALQSSAWLQEYVGLLPAEMHHIPPFLP